MRQKIYPDPYGTNMWDWENYGVLCVHLVNSAQYYEIIGKEPPGTPITVESYTEKGLPWFDLYDEDQGDVIGGKPLTLVKSVSEKEDEKKEDRQGQNHSVDISDSSIHRR